MKVPVAQKPRMGRGNAARVVSAVRGGDMVGAIKSAMALAKNRVKTARQK